MTIATISSTSSTATPVRLWFRYQRYAFALCLLATIVAAGALFSGNVIVIAAALIPVLALLAFAVRVSARFGDKMRVTRIALTRIRQQRFRVESMREHCGDPCFRLVADECLRAAGIERSQRRSLVRTYKNELRQAPATLLLRDPQTGRTILIGGEPTTSP